MEMEEKTVEQLIREGFEIIRRHIAGGATPKERATRAMETFRLLFSGEQRGNEEWDIGEESRRRESHADPRP